MGDTTEKSRDDDQGARWRYSVPWELEAVIHGTLELERDHGILEDLPSGDLETAARSEVEDEIRADPAKFYIPEGHRFSAPDRQTREYWERVISEARKADSATPSPWGGGENAENGPESV